MRAPAFQFYSDDFVAGTSILTTEEVGAYILLLCHQWSTGSIPDDERLIRRIARVTQAFELGLVLGKFQKADGVLKNPRLEEERQKQEAFRTKQAENGRLGGRPKGLGKPNPTQALPKPNPGQTQGLSQTEAKKSSPSPSPINTPFPPEGDGELFGDPVEKSFEAFWALYPNKGAKRGALKAWSKVPAREHPVIMRDIQRRAGEVASK